jgi:hypothetical protein
VDGLVDHHHPGAEVTGVPGGGDGGRDVVPDADQDHGPLPGLVDRQLRDQTPLFGRQRVELAGVAVRGEGRDAAVEQAAQQGPVGVLLDGAVLGERCHRDRHHVGQGGPLGLERHAAHS